MTSEKTTQALSAAEELLKPLATSISNPETFRLDVVLDVDKLHPAIEKLHQAHWGYISAITGLDRPGKAAADENPGTEGWGSKIEVLYHFCEGAAVTTLRISMPYEKTIVPTICDLFPTATLYERELIEMFGVTVEGTPNTDHLLLTDDWPEGVYPLRKSFTGLKSEKE